MKNHLKVIQNFEFYAELTVCFYLYGKMSYKYVKIGRMPDFLFFICNKLKFYVYIKLKTVKYTKYYDKAMANTSVCNDKKITQ